VVKRISCRVVSSSRLNRGEGIVRGIQCRDRGEGTAAGVGLESLGDWGEYRLDARGRRVSNQADCPGLILDFYA